ncbi:MAG: polyprenyl synthetase family protein [Bacteroidales bacterium]|nr:polyprenyl synthetase family protein [Bacteroidales bacterium]
MYSRDELKDVVNRAILNLSFDDETPRLFEPVKYILSTGGKRIRPVMVLMACNMFSDKIDHAILPAVSLEIFHNFTLVHDDIMDNAEVRRNAPSVHSKWNLNQAILSGDVMAFMANECLSQAPAALFPAIFRIYNRIAVEVCKGQQLDMDFEKINWVSIDDYLRMVELKTSVLIAGGMKIGALLGGAGDKDADSVYAFGRNLGLAFQVQDDILDTWGNPALFGKKRGGDIVANKKTLLMIKALELSSGETLKKIQKLISGKNGDIDPDTKVNEIISIYEELGVREFAETRANEFITRAYESLDNLSVDASRKKEMITLASSMTGRNR